MSQLRPIFRPPKFTPQSLMYRPTYMSQCVGPKLGYEPQSLMCRPTYTWSQCFGPKDEVSRNRGWIPLVSNRNPRPIFFSSSNSDSSTSETPKPNSQLKFQFSLSSLLSFILGLGWKELKLTQIQMIYLGLAGLVVLVILWLTGNLGANLDEDGLIIKLKNGLSVKVGINIPIKDFWEVKLLFDKNLCMLSGFVKFLNSRTTIPGLPGSAEEKENEKDDDTDKAKKKNEDAKEEKDNDNKTIIIAKTVTIHCIAVNIISNKLS